MKIVDGTKLDFDDVLIRPKRSRLTSRSEVVIEREFVFPHSNRRLSCVPIVAANMDTVGTIEMAKVFCKHNAITCLHKHHDAESLITLYNNNNLNKELIFYSTGTSSSDLAKLTKIYASIAEINGFLPNICIDVANGYSEKFVRTVSHIRQQYPEIIIMAGNVVTPEMTEELILHGGVDIVKVGIGPGSVCTTRLKTGIGYPQLSAIMECADAAHGLNGHICGDGGCKTPGDICKAFGGNSDFVMLGGMLAGTDCCEGEWEYEYLTGKGFWQPIDPEYKFECQKRKKSLKFYGMSSKEAMTKHSGGVADYRTSEGKCVIIPYKGTTEDTIKDIYGGIRSACTYIGAKSIKDFSKKTIFIKVNNTHNKVFS